MDNQHNVGLILVVIDVLYLSFELLKMEKLLIVLASKAVNSTKTLIISGRERGERDYFTVLNSLADTRENPRFRRFMPLRAVGSDI